MLNKPVNPYPYFNTVDSDVGFTVECTIPNGNVYGASLYVYDNETDELVYGNSITNDVPTENISFQISKGTNMVTEKSIENGRDYYWNTVYYGKELGGRQSATIQKASSAGSNTIYVSTTNSVVWTGTKSDLRYYRWTSVSTIIYKNSSFSEHYDDILANPSNYGMEITVTDGGVTKTNYYTIKGIRKEPSYGDFLIWFNERLLGYVHDDYSLKLHDLTKGGIKPNSIVFIGSNQYTINAINVAEGSLAVELNEKLIKACSTDTPVYYIDKSNIEYNNSPNYYFTAKSTPVFQVVSGDTYTTEDGTVIDNVIDVSGELKAPQGIFNVKYIQDDKKIDLDYLYYNIWEQEESPFEPRYKLIYQSPKYSNIKYRSEGILNCELNYKGFAHNSNYYIECIGKDKNGGYLTAERLRFGSSYYMYSKDLSNYIKCSDVSVLIDMHILLLHQFDYISDGCIYVYRQKRGSNNIEFVGECLVRNGACEGSVFEDFVVANHTEYTYTFSICKGNPQTPYKTIQSSVYLCTDFNGAYIASLLENTPPDSNTMLSNTVRGSKGDYVINTKDCWKLNLKFENSLSTIAYNLSREKVSGFGKYFKILKGNMEAISSDEKYLLGNIDDDCSYFEITSMQQLWRDFVQNEKLKFYRPYVGEPMVIDIMSFSLQPSSYSSGIVNELSFEYVQTDNCKDIQMQIQ